MNDAYRSGYNKGSADKIAGRHEDDAVPPQHRTSDSDRRAFKKGYQEGYRQTYAVRSSGFTTSFALNAAKSSIDASLGGGLDAAFSAGVAVLGELKQKNASGDVVREVGQHLYDKLVGLGATVEQLQKVSDLAGLGITVEGQAASQEKNAGFRRKDAGPRSDLLTTYKRLPGESVADFRARRAKEIAAEDPRTDAGPRTLSPSEGASSSWISSNWPWVAAGTVVLAAGGGYLYYRSSR